MTYDDRILHLQRTIEIILKQNLLSAIHLAPLTFPTSSHQNPSPIVATAAPFSPRLDGFMPSRGYQIEAKALWISWQIIPIFPPRSSDSRTPLTEGTRIPHRGPNTTQARQYFPNSL